MIVATAGHVDHGKTSLVKALTGIDTDRLEEEKRRGLSIELGFAHADLGTGVPVGFVDVPGHERFIRNMVAGVASIDLALLVVAADDGPMPQTREHLAILEWLGVAHCAVAITKVDRVAPERVGAVARDIRALLSKGPFRGSPDFPVDATTGAGIAALREHLRSASAALLAPPALGHFRLAVDRSFSVAGAGIVVTGAIVAGSVRIGDALVVSPHGTPVRVRSIEVHHAPAVSACAGQRCALNVSGADLKRAPIVRGDWIVDARLHAPTDRLDVRLEASATLDKPLFHDATVHLHLAAAAVPARLAVLEGRSIPPGASGYAQLVLERPIGALHGDRFIVRDPSGQRTLGGGRVIDPCGATRGRARPARLAQLGALAKPDHEAALADLLDGAPEGVDLAAFLRARNLDDSEAACLSQRLRFIAFEGDTSARDKPAMALAPFHWHRLRERILGALASAHAAAPDALGASETALATLLGRRRVDALLHAAIRSLRHERALLCDGFCLRLPDHVPLMSAADGERLERIRAVLAAAGLRPPIVGDLATALDASLPALLGVLADLARRGHLVPVAKNRYFLPESVLELARIAHELAAPAETGTFDAAAYRDRSGLGRNLTVEVLEFLDRAGVTRFAAGRRRIAHRAGVLT